MDTYVGFYARFNTLSKKDAAALLGADNLVGDVFEIIFDTNEEGETVAWMKNRFGSLVGFFDADTTRRLRILNAREWHLKAILSFVAFTDHPEPGHYWGEAAIICYSPVYEAEFTTFIEGLAPRIADGVRPDVDLGEQGAQQVIESGGLWSPTKTMPFPAKQQGTVIMKSRRKMSEKLIEQGRKGNKGCYVVSWLFLLLVVAGLLFGLKSCGVF
ncbi:MULTISPECIES: hypothetical protein [Gordonibacter]|uniref:Uncharacterized protein n=1 Tax=Gordonibacter faecis TaxID=3047475 RepID=A0ABT7DKB7_9ACTN|nr:MULTISPECIES: hypothetical protein [unclassified Gordonibacter]MDJ1649976.1 hypothetical protein [Gordonibacter sp. KGMB12511]